MKAKNKISLLGALIMSLPFVTEMAPAATKSKAKNTLALKAPVSSIAYGESVADIDCSNVSEKITQVKPLLPIISNAATQGTINIEKDEFETTEQFQIRQFKHIQTL